jgi:transposase
MPEYRLVTRKVKKKMFSKKIEEGLPPTYREISAVFGISIRGAYDKVKALERKGYVRIEAKKSRAIFIN